VVVGALILLTRARHLSGLGAAFDQLARGSLSEKTRKLTENSHIGIFGLLSILVVLALKFRSVEVLGEAVNQGLLLASGLGRWAMVLLAYGSTSSQEGMDELVVEYVQGLHLFLATVLTLAVAFAFAGRAALWIALWLSLFTLAARGYLYSRFGGLTAGSLGAVTEISETLALVLFATI